MWARKCEIMRVSSKHIHIFHVSQIFSEEVSRCFDIFPFTLIRYRELPPQSLNVFMIKGASSQQGNQVCLKQKLFLKVIQLSLNRENM